MNDQQNQSNNDGHQGDGRFAQGNKCGRGNPFARQTAAFKQEFRNTVGRDGVRKLSVKLYEMALQGNVQAMKMALAYLLGKPDAANPDALDHQEWQMRCAEPTFAQLNQVARNYCPVELANVVVEARGLVQAKNVLKIIDKDATGEESSPKVSIGETPVTPAAPPAEQVRPAQVETAPVPLSSPKRCVAASPRRVLPSTNGFSATIKTLKNISRMPIGRSLHPRRRR